MPYQKNGIRQYKEEYQKYHSKPLQRKRRSDRTTARNSANAAGKTSKGDGKDLDHIKPLSKGGTSETNNLRAISVGLNRSFLRNPDGSLKNQRSRRERTKK